MEKFKIETDEKKTVKLISNNNFIDVDIEGTCIARIRDDEFIVFENNLKELGLRFNNWN